MISPPNLQTLPCRLGQWSLISIAFCLPISTAATNALFLLTALLAAISLHQAKDWHWVLSHPVAKYMLGFALLFLIGITYSEADLIDAWYRFTKHTKFIYAALFLWLFRDKQVVLYALSSFIAAMILWLILCYLKILGILDIYGHLSGHGVVFKSHIHASYLLSLLVFITIARYQITKNHFYLSSVLVFFTLLYLCFFSTGRSGYAIIMILTSFGLYRWWQWRGIGIAVLIIVAGGITTYQLSPHVHQRANQAAQDIKNYQAGERYSSVGLRIDYLRNGIEIIKKSPWLGTGTGSVQSAFEAYEPNAKFHTNNPHNEYINVAVQLGLAGLVYLILMFSHQWWLSYRLPFALQFLSQGVMLATIIGSFANSLLMDTTEGHTYVYFIALTFGGLCYHSTKQCPSKS